MPHLHPIIHPQSDPTLPALLRELRIASSLSLRGLAEKSGIPHSYISNIENGRRPVGQKAAAKLAAALGLTGERRDQFLLAAAQDSPRDKVLRSAMQLPSKVINAFALKVIKELAQEHDDLELNMWTSESQKLLNAEAITKELSKIREQGPPLKEVIVKKPGQVMNVGHLDSPAMPAKRKKPGEPPRIARCFINCPAERLPESAQEKLRKIEKLPKMGAAGPRVFDLAVELANGHWHIWEFTHIRL